MAITSVTTVGTKTVEGDHRKVYGSIVLTGTYVDGGFALTVATLSDNLFTSTDPFVQVNKVVLSGTAYIGHYDSDNAKMIIYSPGGADAHTHAIAVTASASGGHTHAVAVTAGTAGDAVTNNAGVLESTGGQDLATESGTSTNAVINNSGVLESTGGENLVTEASTATEVGATEPNGATLTNMIVSYVAVDIPE